MYCSVMQCVAVCCSVLQCVAVCCSVLQCVLCLPHTHLHVYHNALLHYHDAVCCSVLQCVAVCCSMLHDDVRVQVGFESESLVDPISFIM